MTQMTNSLVRFLGFAINLTEIVVNRFEKNQYLKWWKLLSWPSVYLCHRVSLASTQLSARKIETLYVRDRKH